MNPLKFMNEVPNLLPPTAILKNKFCQLLPTSAYQCEGQKELANTTVKLQLILFSKSINAF